MKTEFSFPLLEESLALDFANTLCGNGEEYFNLFTNAHAIEAWCDQTGHPTDLDQWGDDDLRAFIGLRNSAHELFQLMSKGEPIRSELLGVIEDAANLAARIRRIEVRGGEVVAWEAFQAPDGPATIALLANAVIDLASGPDGGRIARCDAPDCTLLFIRSHGARRFCESTCADRTRQAAYRNRIES